MTRPLRWATLAGVLLIVAVLAFWAGRPWPLRLRWLALSWAP